MLRDVFYYGKKPNAHPREKFAKNLAHARQQATTEHFWIINEFCDYQNFEWDFDFEFLPDEDVWAEEHINIWPSQHQKDSGTWLVNTSNSNPLFVYRADVGYVKRKNIRTDNWVLLDNIDELKFDFSWHPDPTDPPYIYKWGCKYFPAQLKHVLEYKVKGASQEKYMREIVELLPNYDYIVENQKIDKDKFDLSWRPDPLDPPFIYIWGNKHIDGRLKSTLEYHVPGATEKKYMPDLLTVLPETERWVEHTKIDKSKFDLTWRPDPREPDYNYVWGNKYEPAEIKPTLEYRVPGATETKYMEEHVDVLPEWDRWKVLENIDKSSFDFSWRPDPREPALIYVFGNEHYDAIKKPTIEYHCEGATQRKYMDNPVAKLAPSPKLYQHLEDSYLEDYTWLPDPDSPPYIYAWGNQWNKPEDKISVQFVVEGATEYKYMNERAIRKPCMDNWVIPDNIDTTGFDFSWEPSPADPPYIYHFGTQWQKTGGPKYVVPDATEIKYMDFQKAVALPNKTANWYIPENIDVSGFDFSWHPDELDPPYVYIFSTQWALTGGPIYKVEGATEKKYIEHPSAIALPNKENWEVPDDIDIDSFDFSWHPYADDDPFIYEFGTQWQKNGGPRYVPFGTKVDAPIKYIDTRILKAKRKPNQYNFHLLGDYKVDMSSFDFSWHPDNTEHPYIYVFGNQFYTAEKMPTMEYRVEGATDYKYVNNTKINLSADKRNWKINIPIDESSWDFAWVPDPGEPAYIYVWGNQWNPAEIEHTIEYHVPGATEIKYMDNCVAKVLPEMNKWEILSPIVEDKFDFSWRPNPKDPAYIYCFGNNLYPATIMSTVEYKVDGARDFKYMDNQIATLASDKTNWVIPDNLDTTNFDFSWKPNPKDPSYIYEFGTQWQKNGGPRYVVPGAKEIKYMDTQKAKHLENKAPWQVPENLDITGFDFSWHPDNTETAYIYQFGTQWALTGGPRYVVSGATEVKYIDFPIAKALPNKANWDVPAFVDKESFDYSWHPYAEDEPFIYQFGTQHQKTGGPRYITPGTHKNSQVKYIDTRILQSKRLPNKRAFATLNNYKIKQFDYSWHPDTTDEPYIYVFGNNQYPAEIMPTIEYVVPGATQIKYVQNVVAILDVDMMNWEVPDNIDTTDFDFSWKPNPKDPPYIYEFGTQHQKTGGPRYVVPDATEVKYIETQKVKALPTKEHWVIPEHIDIADFDFSWHPDNTDPLYIYQFGTQWALSGGPKYVMPGATEVKYVDLPVAKALPNKDNWDIPSYMDIEGFDFSWHPYAEDEPYIYQFGTQHQKTGGPKYVTPGTHKNSQVKYIDTRILKAKRLPNKRAFAILNNYKIKNFDFSWHPDTTEEPYIYVFGNNQYPAEIMPTIEYTVPGAKQVKYVQDVRAILDVDMTNWVVPENIDTTDFDFSWKPNPKDPPFIYEFGTQHQKNGGPRYEIEGATEVKYVETQKVKALPTTKNWTVPDNIDITDFDFSWHPDNTDPLYIYQFGTQWALSGGPKYTMPGATEIKYMDNMVAKALPNKDNWDVPKFIEEESFDFSWHPYAEDEPYIYQFGTQWQKTGGPKYITPGTHKNSAVKYIDVRILKAHRTPNKRAFAILNNYKIKDFDWSWHPDTTDEPYIYVFGNNQYPAEIMPTVEYVVPGATQIKYVNDVIATLDVDMTNWEIPDNIDTTGFDFSWKPNPKDPPYTYEFGTQHQKNGGPRYVIDGADEIKYIESPKVTALPTTKNWTVPDHIDIKDFDFSWHPDNTDPAYIYQFGTQWALSGGPKYTVAGATEVKYMDNMVAKALVNRENWEIPAYIDDTQFDFSWHPYAEDEPFIYQFGTQWQKTGGPKYITPGTHKNSAVKYIDARILKAKRLPNKRAFAILNNYKVKNFDWSWHPDTTDEPYIYVFGNNQYPAEVMPTIEYAVPGAKQIKYVNDIVATLDVDMTNWEVPKKIDVKDFDFSWKPNPNDPPYIYEFGTQWQKTGGPRYVIEGATETKYVDTQKAKALPDVKNWTLPANIDVSDFDFSWHPDSTSPPYNYHFATQWAISGGPVYKMEGAIATKYMDAPTAKALPNKDNWDIPVDIDSSVFDFSWHPYAEDDPYIYQFGTQHQKTGGPRYITPGAKLSSPVKYIDTRIIKAQKLPNRNNFEVFDNIKVADFDYSWHPDSTDGDEYIYVFGNTQYPAEVMPTLKYVSGPYADKIKYVKDVVAKLAQDRTNWVIPESVDVSEFDFSWVPNPNDPPYIYEFGTQWQTTGGPRYVVEGATEVKYVEGSKAKRLPNKRNWIVPDNIDSATFDFSWHPNANSPPYIYEFETVWNDRGGPKYVVAEATEFKYIGDIKAKTVSNKTNWHVSSNIDDKLFDFSWIPHPDAPPYIYQFGTQHQKTNGPKYIVKDATEVKYVDVIKSKIKPSKENWVIPDGVDVSKFDFSWHPDATSPPYVYQFGDLLNRNNGPVYMTPNATGEIVYLERIEIEQIEEIKTEIIEVHNIVNVGQYYIETTLEDLVNKHPNEVFWALNKDIDYSDFNFDWRPSLEQSNYVHAFGSEKNIDTQTYFVSAPMYLSGNTNYNYITTEVNFKINIDMFFVDRGNEESNNRFESLKSVYGNKIQKTRYLNSWVDTINRCINRATSKLCWILNSELDYTGFNFEYYPDPWQLKMVHVFGTQWSHWGTTFMVNRETFAEDTKYIKIIEHLSNLNFVKDDDKKAKASNCLYDVFVIDHGNKEVFKVFRNIQARVNNKSVTTVEYKNNYLDTLKEILSQLPDKKEQYIWVCSSICDYSKFDFTYICDPFAKEQLHVFPSNRQKFGDTFLVNVNKLRQLVEDMETLQDYNKVNFNQHMRTTRYPAPVIVGEYDTHVASVMADFEYPYAIFVTEDNKNIEVIDDEPMNLWSEDSKNIIVTSTGGTRIIAPKEAKNYIETQLYDYPYIRKTDRLAKSNPLDIVYLSNGEKGADENFEHLKFLTKDLKNRVVRVDGVNGRVQAYHAAAEASETPWMFTVFAKLKVSPKFDFNWQPDRLQMPKHYMFNAKNPLNGLIYGHQGIIAYNKKLVLANEGVGLDFTLDDPHESVNMLSGTANFNTDPFSTWRTAFREVIKLQHDTSDISKERLEKWLNVAEGEYAEYCLNGAKDAVAYYKKVKGNYAKLKLSYEWRWLHTQFKKKYK